MATYRLGGKSFSSKQKIKEFVQRILRNGQDGRNLDLLDFAVVRDLLDWHPNSKEKIGCGVAAIQTAKHLSWSNNLGFNVIRTDGSKIDFSYKACLQNSLASHKNAVIDAFRKSVAFQTVGEKRRLIRETLSDDGIWSDADNEHIHPEDCHLDHYPLSFRTILDNFLREENLLISEIELTKNQFTAEIKNYTIRSKWHDYHKEHAQYRLISADLNIKLGNHQKSG